MDPVKAGGMKKNLSARLERRKKWWSEKKNNTRLTRANAPKEEKVSQGQETAASTTVSSRGFTSTNNASFTSTKPKQNHSKHNISGGKNSFKGAKNQKHKSRPSGKKIKEPMHKNDKMKQKNEMTPEKEGESPLPEVTLVRSFNTAETEMEPSQHSPKKYVLFVGNLPYTVTREQVEEHFKKTGGVKAVRIPKEKGTEKGKGFAYVEFNSHISHRLGNHKPHYSDYHVVCKPNNGACRLHYHRVKLLSQKEGKLAFLFDVDRVFPEDKSMHGIGLYEFNDMDDFDDYELDDYSRPSKPMKRVTSNLSKSSQFTVGGETTMYKDEFYILWNTGIAERDEDVPMATVAVCNITVDDGDAVLIRVFNSAEIEVQKAEDKLLDWISDDPYVNSGAKLDIEIFMNHSPMVTFSSAFAGLLRALENREKKVRVEIKMVRISSVDEGEPDADDNCFGLQELHSMGVELSPVTGKDWQYLREILREMGGLRRQERQCRKTRKKLLDILRQGEPLLDGQENGAYLGRCPSIGE